MNDDLPLSGRPGRPREFDPAQVLDRAVAHFAAHGYHGTSIADLNRALGLTSGSIYKAWGDKRGLFLAAFERYVDQRRQETAALVAGAATGRAKVAAVLDAYGVLSSGEAGRVGCLVVETAMELSCTDSAIAQRIAAQQAAREAQLAGFIRAGQRDGSVAAHVDADTGAALMVALTQGMRVIGKAGASLERMRAIAAEALRLLD